MPRRVNTDVFRGHILLCGRVNIPLLAEVSLIINKKRLMSQKRRVGKWLRKYLKCRPKKSASVLLCCVVRLD